MVWRTLTGQLPSRGLVHS